MLNHRALIFVLAVAVIGLEPVGAQAAVALAVGVTGDPKDGIAYGYSYNYKSSNEAASDAMKSCRGYKNAAKAARRCKLIGSLDKGCFGVAFDSKDDSPGIGWAVREKREDAESRAIEACKETAPRSRRQFCKIDMLRCDGDAAEKKKE